MKKILIMLLPAVLMWACNSNRPSENSEATDSTATSHHHHEDAAEKMELNNGVKWNADSSTVENAENIIAIVGSFHKGTDKSLTAYNKVADDLQNGLDKMISECKMQGPDHDALHKWLMPLIAQVAELKKSSTEVAAAESFHAIDEQAHLFPQFFE